MNTKAIRKGLCLFLSIAILLGPTTRLAAKSGPSTADPLLPTLARALMQQASSNQDKGGSGATTADLDDALTARDGETDSAQVERFLTVLKDITVTALEEVEGAVATLPDEIVEEMAQKSGPSTPPVPGGKRAAVALRIRAELLGTYSGMAAAAKAAASRKEASAFFARLRGQLEKRVLIVDDVFGAIMLFSLAFSALSGIYFSGCLNFFLGFPTDDDFIHRYAKTVHEDEMANIHAAEGVELHRLTLEEKTLLKKAERLRAKINEYKIRKQ